MDDGGLVVISRKAHWQKKPKMPKDQIHQAMHEQQQAQKLPTPKRTHGPDMRTWPRDAAGNPWRQVGDIKGPIG